MIKYDLYVQTNHKFINDTINFPVYLARWKKKLGINIISKISGSLIHGRLMIWALQVIFLRNLSWNIRKDNSHGVLHCIFSGLVGTLFTQISSCCFPRRNAQEKVLREMICFCVSKKIFAACHNPFLFFNVRIKRWDIHDD